MSSGNAAPVAPASSYVARLHDVSLSYGKTVAIDHISLDVPAGCMVGFIGPDGVGKSSTFSLIAGARVIQSGTVEVLGHDMSGAGQGRDVCPRIAYMPQGLGKNLYPTLSCFENVEFFALLFGQDRQKRERRISSLLQATKITLTGLFGYASADLSNLFSGSQKIWLLAPVLNQSVFNAGRTKSGVAFAEALQRDALNEYDKAVQSGFRDVSDGLVQYKKTREIREQGELLVTALEDRKRLAYMRYRGGVDGVFCIRIGNEYRKQLQSLEFMGSQERIVGPRPPVVFQVFHWTGPQLKAGIHKGAVARDSGPGAAEPMDALNTSLRHKVFGFGDKSTRPRQPRAERTRKNFVSPLEIPLHAIAVDDIDFVPGARQVLVSKVKRRLRLMLAPANAVPEVKGSHVSGIRP